MKKIVDVATLVLAMNFLLAAVAAGWVVHSSHMDREKFTAMKELLYPPTSQPSTQPTTEPTSRPSDHLDELLAKASGRPAGDQIEYIRSTFEAERASLDRQREELEAIKRQVENAQRQQQLNQEKVEADRKGLTVEQERASKQIADKGFQDSLALYESMPAKQVKTIFMTLGDDVVVLYLKAMPSQKATKVIKEFKTPEETERIQKIIERIRQAPKSPGQG